MMGVGRARLDCIPHLLSLIPYKQVHKETVKLPKVSGQGTYNDHATMKKQAIRAPEVLSFW
jgi:polyphosphate kinase